MCKTYIILNFLVFELTQSVGFFIYLLMIAWKSSCRGMHFIAFLCNMATYLLFQVADELIMFQLAQASTLDSMWMQGHLYLHLIIMCTGAILILCIPSRFYLLCG
jgi:hypothetical protein